MSAYKTFEDLKFKRHPHGSGERAQLVLANGIEVSVVAGDAFYNDSETYEIAMLVEGKFLPLDKWDDVRGWQTPDEIDALLAEAQEDGVKFMDDLDTKRANARI